MENLSANNQSVVTGDSVLIVENVGRDLAVKSNEPKNIILEGTCAVFGKMNNNKLYTGDIAKKDKDNFFYITGRKDYYIKIFGNRINIQEFQKEINQMGIKCILKSEEKNKISIYIDKNKNKEKIKLFIKQNTQLNLNIFNFKLVNHLIRNKKNELILDIN